MSKNTTTAAGPGQKRGAQTPAGTSDHSDEKRNEMVDNIFAELNTSLNMNVNPLSEKLFKPGEWQFLIKIRKTTRELLRKVTQR